VATDSSPERLPSFADALGEGVVLVEGGAVVAVNAAACALLQTTRERALGAPLMHVVRDHRIEGVLGGDAEVEVVTRGRTLSVAPLPNGLLLRDVSAARRAEESARDLLAVLSHELRTPVTTIRAALEALRFDLPAAQRDRYLARAEGEADRLSRLLSDLTVDVAPPRARSLVLRDEIARARGLLHDLLTERCIELIVEAPAHALVWADADKFLQVLLNLIENAAIHGPTAAQVRLLLSPEPERVGWWSLEVVDQGTPASPEAIEAWFAPHARGSTLARRGAGLGLYIVRSIAQRWGGRAWGRPHAGGNAFGFSAPRDRAAADPYFSS
jgi:two-component system, OmpR family, phosphate regulon sensor histidine kinase PhoR